MRAVGWMGLLGFDLVVGGLAVMPNLGLGEQVSTVLHFTVSAVNVLAMAALTGRLPIAVAVMVALGVGAELAQSVIPGRSASFDDLTFDFAGIAMGACLAILLLGPPGRPARRLRPVRVYVPQNV